MTHMIDQRAAARFDAAVSQAPGGCHTWTRALNTRGYGVFWLDGRLQLAHRVAWLRRHGSWPDATLRVDHICENKTCVNADHLRELTNRDNVMRSPLSPMNLMLAATTCRNGHPYDASTRTDKNGWRVCAQCPSRRGRSQ
jgi:hypothetical protein